MRGLSRRLIAVAAAAVLTASLGLAATEATPSKAPNTTPGGSVFGIAAGCCLQSQEPAAQERSVAQLGQLGARWVRVDLQWQYVAPTPSQRRWAPFDTLITRLEHRHFNVLVQLERTPPWLVGGQPCPLGRCGPASDALWARLAGEAVRRWAHLGVRAWEIWNEPNSNHFWSPAADPVAFTHLLASAYSTIKRADPHSTVVSGGMAAVTDPAVGPGIPAAAYLAGMYAAGARGAFDAVGDHPYCYSRAPDCVDSSVFSGWSQLVRTSPNIRELMIANGDGSKRVWATEFGAPTEGGHRTLTPAEQAALLTRAYTLWSHLPWAGPMFWYTLEDQGGNPTEPSDWFGLLTPEGAPKPAFYAYQKAARSG
jgi:hypothetical protein